MIIPLRAARRVMDKVVQDGDCTLSLYSVASHGYAQVGWHENGVRQMTTAHRAAWVAATGEQIPDGMTVDHLCKNRRCVNPDHLRLLSNFENARRTSGRDWPLGQCANGHPNSEQRRESTGRLRCVPCTRQAHARYRAKQRAVRPGR